MLEMDKEQLQEEVEEQEKLKQEKVENNNLK